MVDAVVDAAEALRRAGGACRECCLDRRPEQWLTGEFFGRTVDLAGGHRPFRLFEDSHHRRENLRCCRWGGSWLAWLQHRFQKKLLVERADPRELNPSSRV